MYIIQLLNKTKTTRSGIRYIVKVLDFQLQWTSMTILTKEKERTNICWLIFVLLEHVHKTSNLTIQQSQLKEEFFLKFFYGLLSYF